MNIMVDKNIPMPQSRGRGAKQTYPWTQMQVGDSFFTSSVTGSKFSTYAASKLTGFRFTTRKTFENGVKGFRCWRIA